MNYHDWSHRVQSVMKTEKDNNMTDHIGVIYIENDIEFL